MATLFLAGDVMTGRGIDQVLPHPADPLVPARDHGFIASADGREIFFHRNSVAGAKFDDLEVGQAVRFAESVGDKGPQATFVQPIHSK